VCCPREMTEIHVVTLVEFGTAKAHAFGHKSVIREITNGSKLFFPPWRNSEPGTPSYRGFTPGCC